VLIDVAKNIVLDINYGGLILLFMVCSGMPTLGPHGFVKRTLCEVDLFVHLSIYLSLAREKKGEINT